MGVVQK
jgi:hypothetical protein